MKTHLMIDGHQVVYVFGGSHKGKLMLATNFETIAEHHGKVYFGQSELEAMINFLAEGQKDHLSNETVFVVTGPPMADTLYVFSTLKRADRYIHLAESEPGQHNIMERHIDLAEMPDGDWKQF